MFGQSIGLFSVGGTAVRLHPTFFLLLIWIGAVYWMRGGMAEAINGIVFVIILFACVVLHEFGHIVMARRFGIRTPDVTLLPIGGLANMERMPEKPGQEILVALAGPAVNLVIAALLFLLLGATVDMEDLARLQNTGGGIIAQVATANLVLFLFNLVPAFPMDGGRVLRAVLSGWYGRTRATRIAATIGQGLAILFGVLGLMGNPFLILIAVFIFLAASGEAGYVEMRDVTQGLAVRDAMIRSYESLTPDDDADAAARLLLRTTQQEFPVVDGRGMLEGVVTRRALVEALTQTGGTTPVMDFMIRDVPSLREDSPLEPAFELIQLKGAPVVAVTAPDGRLTGYIERQNLSELFMLRNARR